MKKILISLMLLTTLAMQAQDAAQGGLSEMRDGSMITFNALSPMMFGAPRFQFGYIYTLNNRWKLSADIGYGNENILYDRNNAGISGEDYRLLDLRGEIYYMMSVRGKWNHYVSCEYFYINHQETLLSDTYISNDEVTTFKYERIDYTRVKQGVNIKYGAFFPISKNLGINFYYGMGIRSRDNTFENPVNLEITEKQEDEFGFGRSYLRRDGSVLGFNFTLGLKLYYRL